MKKRGFLKIAALVLAFCTFFSLAAAAVEENKTDYGAKLDFAIELYKSYGLFADENTDYIREGLIKLFEEDDELFYKFMDTIYNSGDRYSHYMAPEVYDRSYITESSMVGIGITVSFSETEGLVITSVSSGPAKAAGIKAGDVLVAVDGVDVRSYIPAMVVDLIKGEENTKVKISVMRDGGTVTFNVTRQRITVSSVSASKISDKIGYLKLEHFNGIVAFMDFMNAYDDFRDSGINTIILDLRDNNGGGIDCLVNLIDNIIPEKGVPYMSTWSTKPMSLKTYTTEGYGFEFNKFVILVNERTASAA